MKHKNKQTHYHACLMCKGFKYPIACNKTKTMKQNKKLKWNLIAQLT